MTRLGFIAASTLLVVVTLGARAERLAKAAANAANLPAAAPVQVADDAVPVASPAPISGAPVRWRMQSVFGSALILLGSASKRLTERLQDLSNNNIQLSFHEPNALTPPLEALDAVAQGRIDAAYTSPGYHVGKDIAFGLFAALPFGPGPEGMVRWARSAAAMRLRDRLYGRYRVKSLVCGVTGMEGAGWFREPIRSVADLRGLRMRIFGLGARVMQKLGVSVQLLAAAEIYPALEKGFIDATEFSMPYLDVELGFHQVAKHYYYPGWHQPAALLELIVNRQAWNRLTDSQRRAFEAACADNVDYSLREDRRLQQEALATLRSRGVRIEPLPPAVVAAAKRAWNEVAEELSRESQNFSPIYRSLVPYMQ